MRQMIVLSAVLSGWVVTPVSAQATSPEIAPDTGRDQLTIGIAGGVAPQYEGAGESVASPGAVIIGRVSGYKVFSRSATLFVDLAREKPGSTLDFQIGPIAQARFGRSNRIKDLQVRALGRIPLALELGGFVGIAKTGVITSAYDVIGARIAVSRDVSGVHRSSVITPTIEYGTPVSRKTYVGVAAQASYVGKGYGATYFDVRPAGAVASGLAPYVVGGAGFKSWSLGSTLVQSLSGDLRRGFSLFALVNYSQFIGKYRRSPIIATAGSTHQIMAFAGVAYSF